MKISASRFQILFMLICIATALQAQTLINLDTVTYHGYTDTVDYMPIQVNTNGNIVLSGNTKLSATQYNATTSSQLSDASIAWVNSFNTSTEKCFVVASTHDDSGCIYNVGGVRSGTPGNGVDFL